jgi:hypothetical protein
MNTTYKNLANVLLREHQVSEGLRSAIKSIRTAWAAGGVSAEQRRRIRLHKEGLGLTRPAARRELHRRIRTGQIGTGRPEKAVRDDANKSSKRSMASYGRA